MTYSVSGIGLRLSKKQQRTIYNVMTNWMYLRMTFDRLDSRVVPRAMYYENIFMKYKDNLSM